MTAVPIILIVEDNFIIAADLAGMVRQLGYAVVGPLATGEEAVALVRRQPPALVLMDISLSGAMNGIAAATAIRHVCPVPVIFMSAHTDPVMVERMRQAGGSGAITKPFDAHELGQQIELALSPASN